MRIADWAKQMDQQYAREWARGNTMANLQKRNIATQDMMSAFAAEYLPDPVHAVALQCEALALDMCTALPDSRELTAGLRKLLEAKDCFVRAALAAYREKEGTDE